jgi:hypothetical protein
MKKQKKSSTLILSTPSSGRLAETTLRKLWKEKGKKQVV